MSVRSELMEEGWLRVCDPRGKRWLLFPCSVVSAKSNPDDIYQWLDSSSRGPKVKYEKGEQNGREEESGWVWRFAEISHLLFHSNCLADELLLRSSAPPSTRGPRPDWHQCFFFVFVAVRCLISMYWFIQSLLTYISSPCSKTFFGSSLDMIGNSYRTTWSNLNLAL